MLGETIGTSSENTLPATPNKNQREQGAQELLQALGQNPSGFSPFSGPPTESYQKSLRQQIVVITDGFNTTELRKCFNMQLLCATDLCA